MHVETESAADVKSRIGRRNGDNQRQPTTMSNAFNMELFFTLHPPLEPWFATQPSSSMVVI
jgi:hypothetical protein